ncbi:MAG: DoxX family protein [Cyanobacteria bacterium P01_A01_bin.17]
MNDYRTDLRLNSKDIAIAYFLLRLLIGVNFLNHGLTRIGNIPGFVDSMVQAMEVSYFPEPLVRINAFLVPIVELIVGILMIVGWRTRTALTVTSALMVVLMLGVTSVQNWDAAGSQLVYGLILFILLACSSFNTVSVDHWLKTKSLGSKPEKSV